MNTLLEFHNDSSQQNEVITKILVSCHEVNLQGKNFFEKLAHAIFLQFNCSGEALESLTEKIARQFNKTEVPIDENERATIKVLGESPQSICEFLQSHKLLQNSLYLKIKNSAADHVIGDTGTEEDFMMSW